MSLKNKFFNYILLPLAFFLVSLLHFIYPGDKLTLNVLVIYNLILMASLIYKTLYVKEINLFFLFAFSYLIPLLYFSFANKIITSYSHSDQLIFLVKYAYLFCLFFTIIFFFFNKEWNTQNKPEIIRKKSSIIFCGNILVCLLIAFYSKSGESLLSSDGYGQTEINNLGGFAVGEYFLLFFFYAYKFSGYKKINQVILLSVAGIYILKSLAFGLRNEFIQLGIMLFILYYKEKGRSLTYFLFILGGLYFSSIFASFRSNPSVFLSSSIAENLSLKNILDNENDSYISHQGDVIHSSCRLFNFRDNRIVDNSTITSSSLFFFSSTIIPQKFLPEQANMALYRQADYPIGGGGSLFAYFYFWFWYPGVILIGLFIGWLIKNYRKYINSLWAPYFILVFSTFPRWFSYSPINLFKLCVYGMVIYFFYVALDHYMKKIIIKNFI